MDSSLISVIITTFNRNDRLELALNSVISQTYNNTEILIVNDGNQDNFEEWWGTYSMENDLPDHKIHVYHSGSQGANAARGIGLQKSSGFFIAFLDDDDIWLPNKLTNQIKFFVADEKIVLVTSNCYQVDSHGKKIRTLKLNTNIRLNDLFIFNIIGGFSFPLIKKSVLCEEYFDHRLQSAQDWNVWLKIIQDNPGAIFVNSGSWEILYLIEDSNFNKISSNPTKKKMGYRLAVDINKSIFPKHVLDWHEFNICMLEKNNRMPNRRETLVYFSTHLTMAITFFSYKIRKIVE